jgi:hypothetical protein
VDLFLSCFAPLFKATWEGDIDEPPCIDTVEKDQLAVFLVPQVLQKVLFLNKLKFCLLWSVPSDFKVITAQ